MLLSMMLFMSTDLLVRTGIGKFCILNNNSINNKKQYTLALLTGEKITSLLHNVITLYFASMVLYDNAFWVDTYSRINHVSDSSYMVGYVSGGYFLYELIISMVRFKTSKKIYILHGLIGIIVYCVNTNNANGHFYNSMFIMFEISNPFVHFRWFLKNHYNFYNVGDINLINNLKHINDAFLMLTFFCVRILWGSYCTCFLLYDLKYAHSYLGIMSGTDIIIHLLPVMAINILNCYWFRLMVLKLISYIG